MDLGQQLIAILRPDSLADIMVYAVLILSILTLAAIPEKNVVPPYLIYVTMFCCVIDLVRGAGGNTVPFLNRFVIGGENLLSNRGFLTFMIHIIMCLFPMIAGAMTRKHGRKGGYALPLGLTTGIIGGMYVIGGFFLADAVYAKIF
jgi:hypothetical protein